MDLDVVARAASGDRAAFEALYRATVARIHTLARRLVGPDEADEATQEVYVRAWERLSSFAGRGAFEAWLGRLGRNLMLDRIAAGRRRAERFGIGDPDRVAAPSTDEKLELDDAIGALPIGARAVFVLHDVEGRRHAEIAEQLGIHEGTSKSQLHRARRLLREMLSTPAASAMENER